MAEKEIDLRRLVIKAFHMTDVEWGEHNNITTDGHMTVSKEMIDQLVAQDDCIEIGMISMIVFVHLSWSPGFII